MTVTGLHQVDKTQVDTVGGKGANLGELIAAGFPVPPGFIVAADEYSRFIERFNIPANDELPSDTQGFLTKLRQKILDAPLDESLEQLITQHHQSLAASCDYDLTYAVRSSATAEDRVDASFAGQHDTYYYVSPRDISLMVRKCWASLWSDAAFSYRQSQAIEHRSVNMAVVVQELIQSEVSGVTFTADPVSGSESVIVTESSWGMGAAIVDGRVSPDQYLVDKASGNLTSIRISDKKFMVPPSLEAPGDARLIEVPTHKRRIESLSDQAVLEIASLAQRAEQHFGCAQDLEWAITGDKLYLLQSRPITIMGSSLEEPPPGRYILFKPVAENFTDPLTPLTEDLLIRFIPMMTMINGRIYLNFDQIKQLIPLHLPDEDLARLAYLSEPESNTLSFSAPKLALLGVLGFLNYLTMGVFTRRVANMPDDFMHSFRNRVDQVVKDPKVNADNTFIYLFARFRFFEPAGNMVMMANLVAPRYMLFLKVLSQLLSKWADNLPDDAASMLCSGSEGVLSTQMGRDILALANIAREQQTVARVMIETPPREALTTLSHLPEAATFNTALDEFIRMHGHRALKEFELNSVRWEEDPSPVIGMIRNYLLVETDIADAESAVVTRRKAMEQQLAGSLSARPLEWLGHPRQRLIEHLVKQTRYYMKLRENSRFFHIMGFYATRKKILAIETDLLEQGLMKCKDDIFYLLWEEVQSLQNQESRWEDVEDIIRSRRMEHIRRSKLVPPKTIGINIDSPVDESNTNSISGQGASPGQYEGIARVIMDPATDNEIEPGEILIAPYTDPAWTPLFLTAHAAVVEVGSYLSHAGTIAREYGMPCVVDAANCTTNIRTGARIRVDGTNGRVTMLDEVNP